MVCRGLAAHPRRGRNYRGHCQVSCRTAQFGDEHRPAQLPSPYRRSFILVTGDKKPVLTSASPDVMTTEIKDRDRLDALIAELEETLTRGREGILSVDEYQAAQIVVQNAVLSPRRHSSPPSTNTSPGPANLAEGAALSGRLSTGGFGSPTAIPAPGAGTARPRPGPRTGPVDVPARERSPVPGRSATPAILEAHRAKGEGAGSRVPCFPSHAHIDLDGGWREPEANLLDGGTQEHDVHHAEIRTPSARRRHGGSSGEGAIPW